jgi:hypothetical protein
LTVRDVVLLAIRASIRLWCEDRADENKGPLECIQCYQELDKEVAALDAELVAARAKEATP